jgi:uncharacterized membrane protein YphA (DoxX/SURF4 family)
MRRALSAIVHYLTDSVKGTVRDWNSFWYTPVDPTLLGMMRVLVGLMLLYTHGVWSLALGDFFGRDPWLSESLIRSMQAGNYVYSFWWLVPPRYIWLVHGLSMLALALFTIGLWTRLTSILALVVVICYAHRIPEAMFGLDQMNQLLTFYLTIGPSGRAVSVDAWLARRRGDQSWSAPSLGANVAQRLIQIQWCIVYFFAGTAKLQGEAWWNGQSLWRAFANLEYQSFDMTWLAWYPRFVNLSTHVTVWWEVSFCVLIWKPRLRPLVLAQGLLMHLGIGALMGMWTFGLIMLIGLMAFLPNEWAQRAWCPSPSPSPKPRSLAASAGSFGKVVSG